MRLTQFLTFNRTTKNTYRFDAESDNEAVRAIYIQKSAMSKPPARIELVITDDEGRQTPA